jgi:hypothetical protein
LIGTRLIGAGRTAGRQGTHADPDSRFEAGTDGIPVDAGQLVDVDQDPGNARGPEQFDGRAGCATVDDDGRWQQSLDDVTKAAGNFRELYGAMP